MTNSASCSSLVEASFSGGMSFSANNSDVFFYIIDICPFVARGHDFLSSPTATHVACGLHRYNKSMYGTAPLHRWGSFLFFGFGRWSIFTGIADVVSEKYLLK